MQVELLPIAQADELRARPLTYTETGLLPDGETPHGYATFSKARRLAATTDFAAAANAVMTWQIQVRSGLRVSASSLRVELDAVTVMTFGLGPARLKIPCRVVRVVDQPDRQGFAYGTLAGHPESGEEAFIVERDPAGDITFTVSAFSKPASVLARLGGPLTTQTQRLMTNRYLTALD